MKNETFYAVYFLQIMKVGQKKKTISFFAWAKASVGEDAQVFLAGPGLWSVYSLR